MSTLRTAALFPALYLVAVGVCLFLDHGTGGMESGIALFLMAFPGMWFSGWSRAFAAWGSPSLAFAFSLWNNAGLIYLLSWAFLQWLRRVNAALRDEKTARGESCQGS